MAEYEKEYFIGIVMLQSDVDVLKKALGELKINEPNIEKAYNLLELIKAQEKAQKNWNDDDPQTEALKTVGTAVNLAFKGNEYRYECNNHEIQFNFKFKELEQ